MAPKAKVVSGQVPPSPLNFLEPAPVAGSNTWQGTAGTTTGPALVGAGPDLSYIMAQLPITRTYRPPYLLEGKETIIIYYFLHPDTNAMVRKKEKLNWIRDRRQRKQFAQDRIKELGLLLSAGWNPIRDKDIVRKGALLSDAIEAFIKAKERAKLSKHTMRSYRSYCGMLLQWCRDTDNAHIVCPAFDQACAKAFLQHRYLTQELIPRAYNNNITFYHTLWAWMVDTGWVTVNVFHGIKRMRIDPDRPSTKRPPTMEERERIRQYLADKPRFRAFAMLCFHCAIRPNEAFQLRPEHFHLHDQAITVPGPIAKNRRTQGVAIPDVLVPLLEQINIQGQRPDHFVFSTNFEPGTKQEDSRHSGRWWERLRKATGLSKDVTLYQLKHAGGEQLNRDGVSEVDLMNHFRHHDLSETSIYTRRTYMGGVRSVIRKASPF